MDLELKVPLPPDRSYEQLKSHYLVEKAIADRLKKADHQQRKEIYATMYDELFSKVPDHPRLTARENEQTRQLANKSRFDLLKRHLTSETIFLEFAPGDCRFAMEAAKHCKKAYGVDISDQRGKNVESPDNFQLIVYNGYDLTEIEDGSIDVAFSDQLIEHIHPDDVRGHFQLVHRLLKKGGDYVFRTPSWFSGPCDISRYFSDEPEGFHLKEWTYREINQLIKEVGYSSVRNYWKAKGILLKMPYVYFSATELLLGLFARRHERRIAKYLIPSVCCEAIK